MRVVRNDAYFVMEKSVIDLLFLISKLDITKQVGRYLIIGGHVLTSYPITDEARKHNARDLVHGLTHRVTGLQAYVPEIT